MMFNIIKKSKVSKVISSYLAIQLIISTVQPTTMFALTGGPSQPEFNSFTPIGTSDMVNLSSGDFNYNIPIMDVGGYPLNLAYDSGVTMDQEASWVGLGWNLNVGQINRQVRGIPDDFDGDEITYTNKMKPNKTVGVTMTNNAQLVGLESLPFNLGLSQGGTMVFNNYRGVSFIPSFGISATFSSGTSVGMNLTQSVDDGVTISPTVSQSFDKEFVKTSNSVNDGISGSLGIGTSYNSRQGLSSFNMSASVGSYRNFEKKGNNNSNNKGRNFNVYSGALSSSISFEDNTFTPTKRSAYNNINGSLRVSVGGNAGPVNFEGSTTAFFTVQQLKENVNRENSFGYENTSNATKYDILDFNRENERIVDKNTLSLPTTNYTYDLYNINSQGTSGQFRPFKSQVGYVYNQLVEDSSDSFNLGGEFQIGYGGHGGVDVTFSPTTSWTGLWEVPVLNLFKPASGNPLKYEETYFKQVGDMSVDDDVEIYKNSLAGEKPIALKMVGTGYNKRPSSSFQIKDYVSNIPNQNNLSTISSKIKRNVREKRNKAILKVTNGDANADKFVLRHNRLKPHHTAGMRITNADGSTYVYGEAAVNKSKDEVTFGVAGSPNYEKGTINSNDNVGPESARGFDEYYNKIETPAYAHTYLLTAVLSADYEDIDQNGPSDNDLGSFTKFEYEQKENDYKWRIPLEGASYNPGLYTKTNDQKGSYISGRKEIKYVSKITTKTHVAVFDLTKRDDGKGVEDSYMYKISTIKLYSKPEYKKLTEENDNSITPIKTAHFEYDYSLCQGVDNNDNNQIGQQGKLTLQSVYFTYRGSNMGKYTPYKFNYDNDNPDYQMKSYDIWGNYKPLFDVENPNLTSCEAKNTLTAQEFPFVNQTDKEVVDSYVSAWTLSSVDLPSGGRLNVEYESDDYSHVQDRKPMQMFKVKGISAPESEIAYLYDGNNIDQNNPTVIIELNEPVENKSEFIEKYIGDQMDKPIFFRFLMNMTLDSNCEYDYVEGYFNLDINDQRNVEFIDDGAVTLAKIPVKSLNIEGGTNGNEQINPFSKAGFYFARENLNRFAYGTGDNTPSSTNVGDIVNAIVSNIGMTSEIFRGPNVFLKERRQVAKTIIPEKSWIRLKHPSNAKLGGGIRVKSIKMDDKWDKMLGYDELEDDEHNVYSNFYGQEYSYSLPSTRIASDIETEDLKSSGVATWEPNMSKENPFIEPFFDDKEKLVAKTYVEKPFGKSFFPAANVTYSHVEVKNLSRENQAEGIIVKKHATGKVIHEFYTSKDFPTKADFTEIDDKNNYISNQDNFLDNLLNLNIKTELALSQGFSVVTNDMNGKQKKQWVYDENGNAISGVEYKYNISSETGELDNELPVLLDDGRLENRLVGTHYDVITDFNESNNLTEVYGANVNLTIFVVGIFPIILGMVPFEYKTNRSILRTTTTTKVVHKSGILKEKIAYDLGSKVSTRNLAWDGLSGQVLLTETDNEYDDNYYNLTYPAHWAYDEMGQAVENLGIEFRIKPAAINSTITNESGDDENLSAYYEIAETRNVPFFNISPFINIGDEVLLYGENGLNAIKRLWVNEKRSYNALTNDENGNTLLRTIVGIILIDENGRIHNACGDDTIAKRIKVVRPVYRNMQNASMASITSLKNPLEDEAITRNEFDVDETTTFNDNPKVINASAVEYKDYWKNPNDGNLRNYPDGDNIDGFDNNTKTTKYPYWHSVNPYLHNIKGDWRAVKSYAYLTGRDNEINDSGSSPRYSGYFKSFKPYYEKDDNGDGFVSNNSANWTFASEVTQYSQYGAEVENKDALNRYSAAQYGYGYTLPVAVASNSQYSEMGYDGFEDYNNATVLNNHFRTILNVNGPQPTPGNNEPPRDVPSDNVNEEITTVEAHTGQYSLKVSQNMVYKEGPLNLSNNTTLSRLDCSEPEPQEDCDRALDLTTSINQGNIHVFTYQDVFGTTDVTSFIPSFQSGCISSVEFNDEQNTIRVIVESSCDSACGHSIDIDLTVDGEFCSYSFDFNFNRGGNGPGHQDC